ncbi:hypothetical protein PanWU01x14_235770 [Parasponia andersonii]|uniref:Uncharacterized protein n=1 Tax=Parasponia andersonii TaxID=3476 RepID=A0A2P5BIU1_PARAD|nr:hypothetical protein PanWU01x14_235770 [Parasponia andersonii]
MYNYKVAKCLTVLQWELLDFKHTETSQVTIHTTKISPTRKIKKNKKKRKNLPGRGKKKTPRSKRSACFSTKHHSDIKDEAKRKTQTSRDKKSRYGQPRSYNIPYYSKWIIQRGQLINHTKKKKQERKNPQSKNRIASFMAKHSLVMEYGLEK